MYNQKEAAAVRQKFWTNFGKYMSPVPDALAQKINWINYKTGVKGIYFKMNADNNQAVVLVEIPAGNDKWQEYYSVFLSLKKQFEKVAGKNWTWTNNRTNADGKMAAVIWIELNEVNIFRETDWPEIITFLKRNVVALDTFWKENAVVFEMT